jgi:hypothetical protein
LVKLETRPPSDGKPRASTAANDTNATVEQWRYYTWQNHRQNPRFSAGFGRIRVG